MITKEDLQQKYETLSNDKLLEIVDNKFKYTDLAVSIAIQEFSKRNLSEEDIGSYKEREVEKINTYIKRNIVDDLTLLQKNLFFFIWLPLLTGPFKHNFVDDGYLLKLKQANYYSLGGFVSFILSVIIPFLLDLKLSTVANIAIWVACFVPVYMLDEFFNRQRQIEKMRKLFKVGEEDNNYEKEVDVTDEN